MNITETLNAILLRLISIKFELRAICPSCLMFGSYKGNTVISLEEASIKLRKQLDLCIRQGTLKAENI